MGFIVFVFSPDDTIFQKQFLHMIISEFDSIDAILFNSIFFKTLKSLIFIKLNA